MTFYPLASNDWDHQEKDALFKVIESNKFTMGAEVKKFEKQLANFHTVKHAVMTNSGSSANLLMISALCQRGDLEPGDEIIVPAVGWSTTFFPIHQYGLKLVFVDVDLFGNLDENKILDALTEKTKAIFVINLLGFPAQLGKLQKICQQQKIHLLEDNCESFGATFEGKMCGSWGIMGSLSFFYSHHITAMEGGCVLTDDDELADYIRVLRAHGWIRDIDNDTLWQKAGNEFEDSFTFILPGYNLRPLELSAAVGQVQLKKWPFQCQQRLKNAIHFCEIMQDKSVTVPKLNKQSTWFGLPMLCESQEARTKLIERCNQHGIQSRPIVAGNFLNQPVIKKINYTVSGTLSNADRIDKTGIFFGNDGRNLSKQLSKLGELI